MSDNIFDPIFEEPIVSNGTDHQSSKDDILKVMFERLDNCKEFWFIGRNGFPDDVVYPNTHVVKSNYEACKRFFSKVTNDSNMWDEYRYNSYNDIDNPHLQRISISSELWGWFLKISKLLQVDVKNDKFIEVLKHRTFVQNVYEILLPTDDMVLALYREYGKNSVSNESHVWFVDFLKTTPFYSEFLKVINSAINIYNQQLKEYINSFDVGSLHAKELAKEVYDELRLDPIV